MALITANDLTRPTLRTKCEPFNAYQASQSAQALCVVRDQRRRWLSQFDVFACELSAHRLWSQAMRCFGVPPRCISGPDFFVLPLATATAPARPCAARMLALPRPRNRPFPREFHRVGKGLNDLATKLTACAACAIHFACPSFSTPCAPVTMAKGQSTASV